jgi:16S rRNA (cytosine967-C5)-methyltransferase
VADYLLKHIQTAQNLIDSYPQKTPFANYLSSYFSENKKYGSKDRRNIREACYAYFRWGLSLEKISIENKIKLFLWAIGRIEEKEILALFNQKPTNKSFENILEYFGELPPNIFPCSNQVSNEIPINDFSITHLQKPKVFFRIVKTAAIPRLKDIEHEEVEKDIFATSPETQLQDLVSTGMIQIQDYASQEVCKLIETRGKVWDICAGAGGKTIHLASTLPQCIFFVSDIRKSIIENLNDRASNILGYQFFSSVLDLSQNINKLEFKKNKDTKVFHFEEVDTILADVPCTGSGTWRRTPENLRNMNSAKISNYAELQISIVKNAVPFLKKGGKLYYITCSVYSEENEENVKTIEKMGFELIRSLYVNKQKEGGDILYFAELLKK